MYNLIKRALVTIDENEKVKLYKKEDAFKVGENRKKMGSQETDEQSDKHESEAAELSPAVSLAKEKARVIIEEAEKEAGEIIEKAKKLEAQKQKAANQLIAKSKSEIKAKEESIKKQWEERYKSAINSLNEAKRSLEKSKNDYSELTSSKIRLILSTLIRKVLYFTMEDRQQEMLEKKIAEMVTRVMSLKEIVFKFNPADIKTIPEELKKEMRETLSSFEIRQDASISRGGVIVETNYGTLDGTLENQLEIIDDMVEQVFGEEE